MCEIADRDSMPVHIVPLVCHKEAEKPDQKTDKIRRLRNIALKTLLP